MRPLFLAEIRFLQQNSCVQREQLKSIQYHPPPSIFEIPGSPTITNKCVMDIFLKFDMRRRDPNLSVNVHRPVSLC